MCLKPFLNMIALCLVIEICGASISLAATGESVASEEFVSEPNDTEIQDLSSGLVYYDRRQEGWFWHRNLKKRVLPEKKDMIPKMLPPTMKEIREQAENLLNRAVENPTKDNIHAYISYQQLIFDRTEKFARTWQRVLWEHPELDPSVENPTVTAGLSAARAEVTRKRDDTLLSLAEKSGLIYFFSSHCPLCEIQSPILASFTSTYGFQVIAISVDGSEDPLFNPAKVDHGAAERLGVKQLPTIFLAAPDTKDIRRVGTGLLSIEDLMTRLTWLNDDHDKSWEGLKDEDH
jgi:conjugal transfer pilus assembly protein TraF